MPIFGCRFFSDWTPVRDGGRQFALRMNVAACLTSVLPIYLYCSLPFSLPSSFSPLFSIPLFFLFLPPSPFRFLVLWGLGVEFTFQSENIGGTKRRGKATGRNRELCSVTVCFSSSWCVCFRVCLALCNPVGLLALAWWASVCFWVLSRDESLEEVVEDSVRSVFSYFFFFLRKWYSWNCLFCTVQLYFCSCLLWCSRVLF